jgi:ribosomal protein S18 acetylase RimI-like enzyme
VSIEVRLLGRDELPVLERVAPDVFDRPVDARLAAEFLDDPRHHLAVARDGPDVVGFASAVHYVHPDKPAELWINEVGVAASHRRLGIARRLLDVLLAHGKALGCVQAWVLTSPGNAAARRLYEAAGGQAADEPSVMYEFSLRDEAPERGTG